MKLRILLVSLVLLSACQSTESPSASETPSFVSEEHHLTMDNTVGWEQVPFPGVVVVFLSPKEGPQGEFRANINVVTEPADGYTAEEYLEGVLPVLEKTITDFKALSTGTMVIDGQTVPTRDATYTQGQYKLKGRQVYLVKNNTAYVTTYTASVESFEKYLADGMTIASSLKVD